jgi:MFS family permease
MSPGRISSSYKWQVVGMLWLVCAFNYADRQCIFSVFPRLKAEFGFGPVQLGLIGSAFMWTYALGSPVAGFVGDHLSRKRLILGGCLFWSATTALTGLCTKFWQFVTVRAVVGVGETVYFPASLSLLSDYHGRRTRSRALSIHQSGIYIGTILGGWLGAWFAVNYCWRAGLYFFGVAGAIMALVMMRFLKDVRRGAANAEGGQKGAASEVAGRKLGVGEALRIFRAKPTAYLLMLVFLGANFVGTIFLTWTPSFLVDKFNFSLIEAGLFGTLYFSLASAVGSPLGGWLADRLAQNFVGGRMLVQASGLLTGAALIALVALTPKVGVLLGSMTLFGFCKGLYDSNIWASLYDVIEPRARGTATGIMNSVGWGGGALGPTFVGLVTKYGRHASQVANMSEAIASGAAIYVVCGVAMLLIVFSRAGKDILPAPAIAANPSEARP